MSDSISRQAAIKAVIAEGRSVDSRYLEAERIVHESDAVEVLSMLPSADAVEVVRCKDGVYSETMITTGLVYCNEIKTACSEEGYCYVGERREDGEAWVI